MKYDYDILIVGAGISTATIAAELKNKFSICIIDTNSHIGGLCYDYKSNNSYIQAYGPHILHTNNKNIISFLSNYTELNSFYNKVEAEIYFNNKKIRVPFPYSKETIKKLTKELSHDEIIDIFFNSYSQKMWGRPFRELPTFLQKRVPQKIQDESNYYPGQLQFLPKYGYTNMIKNMIKGTEIILNACPNQWKSISAKTIIYCGRIDLISPEKYKTYLEYKTSKIEHKIESNNEKINIVNLCHNHTRYIRKTFQKNFYNDRKCKITTYEKPTPVTNKNTNPFYPYPTPSNVEKYKHLKKEIEKDYPNIFFLGRNGTYQYLDIDQAIEASLNFAEKF